MRRLIFLLVLCTAHFISAQPREINPLNLRFSGQLHPLFRYQTSNYTQLDLPFRIASGEVEGSIGELEVKGRGVLETRWSEIQFIEPVLRELYLHWYPEFGEVKIGQLIHRWGLADGRNPTDNLSPYNFYYLFETGNERKVGELSLSMTVNFGRWDLETLIVNAHRPNVLPFDEEDLPLTTALYRHSEHTHMHKTIKKKQAGKWGN